MQFVIIGLDGKDKEASNRRTAVRQDHIAMGDKLLEAGNLLFGAALLNEDSSMKGSLYVMSFKSEEQLKEWMDKEPYIVGGVWRDVTVHKSSTRDIWQFSHSKEWFEDK